MEKIHEEGAPPPVGRGHRPYTPPPYTLGANIGAFGASILFFDSLRRSLAPSALDLAPSKPKSWIRPCPEAEDVKCKGVENLAEDLTPRQLTPLFSSSSYGERLKRLDVDSVEHRIIIIIITIIPSAITSM